MPEKPNIVLVHGAWADGSCWDAVTRDLQGKGYKVTAPQFPETSTDADVARQRLLGQDGLQPAELTLGAAALDVAFDLGRDPRRVVAAILQPFQAFDQPRRHRPIADNADDATHGDGSFVVDAPSR